MEKRPVSLQDIHRERQQEEFVGREEHLAFFQENLGYDVEDPRRRFIINVHGQGGVGKTRLLHRFQNIAEEAGAITACSDEAEKDVPSVMGRIAEQFEAQGHTLAAFAQQYKVYLQRWQELLADEDASTKYLRLVRPTASAPVRSTPQILGIGFAAELGGRGPFAKRANELSDYVVTRFGSRKDALLVLEPVETLTPLFLAGLQEHAEERSSALFLDTYERTGRALDGWLRALLEGRYGSVPADITLVIAGRDALDRNHWDPYEGLVARLSLEPFTKREVMEYLACRSITENQLTEVILRLSGRLPLLVAILAAESPDDPAKVGDPSGHAVDRFLKWIEDPKQRQVALDAALLRYLNRDVVAVLLGNREDAIKLFGWLRSMPFVNMRGNGWIYHEVVREQMLRYGRQESRQDWSDLHARLTSYYESMRDGSGWNIQQVERTLPEDYELAAIRQLMRDALSTQELRRICQEHPDLQPVVSHFGPSSSLEDMMDTVVDYCTRQLMLSELLMEIRRSNPRQFQRYQNQLHGSDVSSGHTALSTATPSALREDLDPESAERVDVRDETWCRYALEALYHRVCQNPQRHLGMALNGFVAAVEARHEFASRWADTVQQAGMETGNEEVESWGAQLLKGSQALAEDQWEVSLEMFDALLESDRLKQQWQAVAFAHRGMAYWSMQRYDDALGELDRALELNPGLVWALGYRGMTYRHEARYEEALAEFSMALELDPNVAWIIANQGMTYEQMGRYEEALTNYNRALAMEPDVAWVIASRGIAYREMGHCEQALADFDHALELEPDQAWIAANRGVAFREMGRHDEALADFDHALESHPDTAWIVASRGVTYQQMDRYDEALADYDRAIGIRPDLTWAVIRRGMMYREADRYEEALAGFDQALKHDPDDAWTTVERGITHRDMGRYEKALDDFNRAIELERDPKRALAGRGATYLLMGEHRQALTDFDRVLEMDPEWHWIWAARGMTHLVMGDASRAQANFSQAIDITRETHQENPTNHYNTLNLALYYLAIEDVAEAELLCHEALAGPPQEQIIRQTLRSLDSILRLFPEHAQARAIQDLLQSS